MEWLKKLIPLAGTALAGPYGGIAASFIAEKLGLEDRTVEAVTKIISSGKLTPEQVSQLKLAELDMEKFMAEMGIKKDQLVFEDRKSAREMQNLTKSTVPAVLTYALTLGFFGVLAGMFAYPEIKESAPLMIMLGSLGTAWTSAVAFWFGTTNGSQNKDAMLANSQPLK